MVRVAAPLAVPHRDGGPGRVVFRNKLIPEFGAFKRFATARVERIQRKSASCCGCKASQGSAPGTAERPQK
ncbi:CMP-N-acetylneuraminate-beta-galactosamide-alpha-23-sialyltransferase 2 [Dissostichus eleginoides]|uniref:CMP-N-acetylneuraminate-beta-galactosamide-alpha-23-sialyltransferase 2 n=1 Tax=Dissostichus eleginoides TaxID=100907 RepID=A0AAD9C054_DISEL|nr:CMP-N-acetylneuraminate-beta-galactosamide-alpha-23-sialyltransferase 2 [Dissostichus eleginoides]